MVATRVRKSLPVEAKTGPQSKSKQVPASAPARVQTIRMQPAYATAAVSSYPSAVISPMRHDVEEIAAVVEPVSSEDETDKHPFMETSDAPMCPACNVPMILTTQKRLLRKAKQTYICPNAPACTETYPVES